MQHLTTLAIVAAAGGMLAACDSTLAPAVAAVSGTTVALNGRSALVLSPGALTLATGSTFQLNSNAPLSLQNLLQWSSRNPTVATVSPSGVVFGASAGTATITARYADDTTNIGTATITVTGATNTANRTPRMNP